MIPYAKYRLELMSSREAQAYLRKNDLAILPVGCFEMHGPDVPLGCDGLTDWAMAMLLAKEWTCVTLPPIWYSFPGATGPWPGTVDISTRATQDYVKAVVGALLDKGFNRVVLCASHGPMSFVLECIIRDLYQATGKVVIRIRPYDQIMAQMRKADLPFGEDGCVLGAMKILGLHGAFDPAGTVDKPARGKSAGPDPLAAMGKLRACSVTAPYSYGHALAHTGPRKGLKLSDADAIAAVLQEAARAMKDVPKHFREHQKAMARMHKAQSWNKPGVWG
ncbi:MAG: creatininase family protein [Kiritimatiellae bacterium]|nr:creatininase family protein [Kiritimatiellia bacterium]